MKKEHNRITMTLKEADEIRELLETLFAMDGTLDEDFNAESKSAGRYARKMCELLHGHRNPQWGPAEPPLSRYEIL